MSKELGKITSARFGFGGYQDAQFGLSLCFEGKGWGVSTFIGQGWSTSLEWSKHCKWTEEDRDIANAEMCRAVDKILQDAKVSDVSKLKGIPVEVDCQVGSILKSSDWRILTECL